MLSAAHLAANECMYICMYAASTANVCMYVCMYAASTATVRLLRTCVYDAHEGATYVTACRGN